MHYYTEEDEEEEEELIEETGDPDLINIKIKEECKWSDIMYSYVHV